jgi:mono/diheme cytochrome c family protein
MAVYQFSVAHLAGCFHNSLAEDDMTLNRLMLLVATVASLIWITPVQAQETEVIAGGELEYQNHCAICHGVDGKGYGIMAKFLTISPADLTQIAKKNGGKFPFWQVYRVIDGREEVRGHGTREMPIWGARFQAEAKGSDPGSRAQAAGRILGLGFYLEHLQE